MILYHRIDGKGESARLVLIHPVGLDHASFDGLVDALGPGLSILRMDLRGHGRSPGHPPAEGLDDYARDVHELLAATRFAPAVVAGFSFGGMVAQALTTAFPSDVSALVAGTCPCAFTAEQRPILVERGGAACCGGMQAVVDATLERWFSDEFRRGPSIAAYRQRLLDDSPEDWARAWQAMATMDIAERIRAISVPTLCLATGADKATPPAVMAAVAERIPGASLVVMPDASHMPFIERPESVAKELRAFLRSLA